jgi:hypothetical protein
VGVAHLGDDVTPLPSPRTTSIAAIGLLVAGSLAACAPDDGDADAPANSGTVEPEDGVGPDPDPDAEADPEAGEELDPGAEGVLLAAMPDCGASGDTVTFTAEGLEAGEDHVLRFDDEPTEDGSLDRATPVTAEDDGTFEVDLSFPEDAPLATGDTEVELLTADDDGEADGFLISVPFEIADECPTG